eukprot:scpid56104/ scgid27707/ 
MPSPHEENTLQYCHQPETLIAPVALTETILHPNKWIGLQPGVVPSSQMPMVMMTATMMTTTTGPVHNHGLPDHCLRCADNRASSGFQLFLDGQLEDIGTFVVLATRVAKCPVTNLAHFRCTGRLTRHLFPVLQMPILSFCAQTPDQLSTTSSHISSCTLYLHRRQGP